MPALYRLADGAGLPLLKEGFGLCVLEAMACGTPVVVSRIAPFTEYLGERDALLCDPDDPASIAGGDGARRCARKRRRGCARTASRSQPAFLARRRRAQPRRLSRACGSRPMPEMRFVIRWPDGRRESCYSPSLVVHDYFREGESYALDDFLVAPARR